MDKRVIDTNAAAEAKVRHYLELLDIKDTSHDDDNEQGDVIDFVPGLFASTVEEIPVDEQEELMKNQLLMQEVILREQPDALVTEKAAAIIEEAKEEVNRIIEDARSEAFACAEQIKKDAYTTGYQEGYEKAMKEFEILKKNNETEKQQLAVEYEKKVREFEPIFAYLLIAYIKRFTGVILDDKKDIILYLLEQELLNIESSKVYLIHVSREDFEMVHSKKHEIAWKVNDSAEIEIIEDRTLTRAQCLIETDSRVIDCSLDVQLKNLVHDLKLLAGPKGSEM
jgi:flagellar assembly protein FliH